jgi:hypothetical protein
VRRKFSCTEIKSARAEESRLGYVWNRRLGAPRLATRRHVKNLHLLVKQKPVAAILARAIALGLCFFDSTSAQPSEEKPEKAFWPREVKISEDIKLEQKTKYGVVTAKRIAGSVVKVVNLDSDSLRIESDGFQGTISVAKPQ